MTSLLNFKILRSWNFRLYTTTWHLYWKTSCLVRPYQNIITNSYLGKRRFQTTINQRETHNTSTSSHNNEAEKTSCRHVKNVNSKRRLKEEEKVQEKKRSYGVTKNAECASAFTCLLAYKSTLTFTHNLMQQLHSTHQNQSLYIIIFCKFK